MPVFQKGHRPSEETRKKMSESAKKRIAREGGPWMKGRKHTEESRRKIREARARQIDLPTKYRVYKPLTDEQKKKISDTWKKKTEAMNGKDRIGKNEYTRIHRWARKYLGKPYKCEKCGIDAPPDGKGQTKNYFHWSNKSGDYKREPRDWEMLCCRCHRRKDLNQYVYGVSRATT